MFNGRHGVRPAEREKAQPFEVDIEVETDLSTPGRSDRVEDTVDYRRLYAIARDVIEGQSAQLIETLASKIAERVLDLQKVAAVSVRIAKRPESMRPIAAAAVHIRRSRE